MRGVSCGEVEVLGTAHSTRALEPIRKTLQADQMDLSVKEDAVKGTLKVEVLIGDESCVECLVPEPMLRQLIERKLSEGGVVYSSLDFRYPKGGSGNS